ncbi:MAG TPA: four helix bundle protein [Gemmatimonadaceae bacterium]|nr:four helix bundle protein [Gemmatimonadaceae bacterium]
MADFKELIVWQRARALAVVAYRLTRTFPAAELQGLSSQIQRAAVSIPANIAESSGRKTSGDQARLYQIAIASSRELESHLLIAGDLGFIPSSDLHRVTANLDEIQRMLMALMRSTRRPTHISKLKSPVSRTLNSRLSTLDCP